jgi:hypothetical protein
MVAVKISVGALLIIIAAWLAIRSLHRQKMNKRESKAAEAEWSYDI